MIPGGDDGDACPQKINGNLPCYSATAGSVFAVHDDKIQSVFLFQLGQPGDHCRASRLADNVAKKKNG